VNIHRACENLLVVVVANPGEGVEGAGAATKAVVLGLVLVLAAVLVLVAAAILLGAAGFLDLLKGKLVPNCVSRGLALSAVIDARSIKQAVRVEPLTCGRSSRGPRLSRREYFGSRCP
jgi:hypothetical protein